MKTHIRNLPNLARLLALVLLSTLNLQLSTLFAQGTAFTYQGRLTDQGVPANGTYDFRFRLFDALTNGSFSGGVVMLDAVGVSDGLFTVTLGFNGAPFAFNGSARWLDIGVKTNGSPDYIYLVPRQAITATPYAVRALSLTTNGLAAGAYSSAVTFNNAANTFAGAFNGDGTGLTDVNALTLGGLSASSLWQLGGNGGTTAGTHFLGTTDNQAVELKVNGTRALRLEPNTNGAPNVIGGSPNNFAGAGVMGATIGGGGAVNWFGLSHTNKVLTDFGTVGGGIDNTSSGFAATVGGGIDNTSSDYYATVGGGYANTSGNLNTTVGGGFLNTSSATDATVGGGSRNTSSGGAATVPGGSENMAAGTFSFAAGQRANALHHGAFVWADSQNADFASTADNQFLIRASGGVGINTASPGSAALAVNGHVAILSANVLELGYGVAGKEASAGKIGYQTFTPGALDIVGAGTTGLNNRKIKFWCEAGATFTGTIIPPSDRNLKQDFEPLNTREVLDKVVAMPVQRWAYKFDTGKRHIGPVAQDFHAAFGLNGDDDTGIATVDADGVALAAIQGLNQKLEEQRAENAELKTRLEKLEQLMNQKNGGAK